MSDMDMAGLAFFDECTERVEEENGMHGLKYFLCYLLIPISIISCKKMTIFSKIKNITVIKHYKNCIFYT